MSRVGKMPIAIPAGVTVTVTPENVVTVKGPKGELVKAMHKDINIAVEDAQETCYELRIFTSSRS